MNRFNYALLIIFLGAILISQSCKKNKIDPVTGEGVFTTISGSDTIEGELFLPDGPGPFPSMIIIPGSGNEPRAEFEVFASILNPNGYALYIYDKRGVGNSTGSYPPDELDAQMDFLNARADDILGIIDLLKAHDQIDNERIGIHGSSQGAWVNSVVYDRSDDLAYIVMASGGVASTGLERFYCGLTDDPNTSIDEAIDQLSGYNGTVGFDPLPIIESMDLPVLWIYGNEDRSHPARYDVSVLDDLNKDNFTIQLYPNVSHELVDITTGQPPADLYQALGMWLMENN